MKNLKLKLMGALASAAIVTVASTAAANAQESDAPDLSHLSAEETKVYNTLEGYFCYARTFNLAASEMYVNLDYPSLNDDVINEIDRDAAFYNSVGGYSQDILIEARSLQRRIVDGDLDLRNADINASASIFNFMVYFETMEKVAPFVNLDTDQVLTDCGLERNDLPSW